jgi:predicted P-loop ATPase
MMFQEKDFQIWRRLIVQEFLDCYPAKLTEEDTEQLTALS